MQVSREKPDNIRKKNSKGEVRKPLPFNITNYNIFKINLELYSLNDEINMRNISINNLMLRLVLLAVLICFSISAKSQTKQLFNSDSYSVVWKSDILSRDIIKYCDERGLKKPVLLGEIKKVEQREAILAQFERFPGAIGLCQVKVKKKKKVLFIESESIIYPSDIKDEKINYFEGVDGIKAQ